LEGVTIRRATLEDVPLLLRYRRAMAEDMGCTDARVLDAMLSAVEPYLRASIPEGRWHAWIAEPGGSGAVEIVPWIPGATDPTPRRAWIHNVYVEPAWRRRGIARALVEAIVAWCRAEGFLTIYLHASEQGRPLYASLGFAPSSEMRLKL